MDNETLKLIAGPMGAVVVLAIVAWKLWARNERAWDDLMAQVKESVKADMDTAAALRELAQLIRGRS